MTRKDAAHKIMIPHEPRAMFEALTTGNDELGANYVSSFASPDATTIMLWNQEPVTGIFDRKRFDNKMRMRLLKTPYAK